MIFESTHFIGFCAYVRSRCVYIFRDIIFNIYFFSFQVRPAAHPGVYRISHGLVLNLLFFFLHWSQSTWKISPLTSCVLETSSTAVPPSTVTRNRIEFFTKNLLPLTLVAENSPDTENSPSRIYLPIINISYMDTSCRLEFRRT